jgi:1,2-dihydroxy-3-keto-5-methylthiopentene dioxygenase
MTLLQVMTDDGEVELRTEDPAQIGDALRPLGVEFERWDLRPLPAAAGTQDVLDVYADDIEPLCKEREFKLVDVVALRPDPDDPGWAERAAAARSKFLDEHSHDEDEVRFFVEGRGCFYLHVGDRVYAVVCEGGDLLSVPRGTTHWFDMGTRPHFTAVRFFQEEDGWVGNFTGDKVSARFPTFDELVSA